MELRTKIGLLAAGFAAIALKWYGYEVGMITWETSIFARFIFWPFIYGVCIAAIYMVVSHVSWYGGGDVGDKEEYDVGTIQTPNFDIEP